ncbi:MAG: protein-glutamate O-methyltransferase CheR [Actinomycetota bacterium]|nr:protein-glutamate O-methyltransferase CheR [Actinomycetota bacterium]
MAKLQHDDQFQELLAYLRATLGFEAGSFSASSTLRAITRRVRAVGAADFGDYLSFMQLQPEESARLAHSIILNFTGFFRERPAWDFLATRALADIAARTSAGRRARMWSAGCASGEETYTLAMLAAEALGTTELERRVAIYGTDVDEEALAYARRASYTEAEVEAVPRRLRRRYLERTGDVYRINDALARSVTFARHDLLQDAPLSDVDLVICRHTLMYFDANAQARILDSFHRALREAGFLFLESTDRAVAHGRLFASAGAQHALFVRVDADFDVAEQAP